MRGATRERDNIANCNGRASAGAGKTAPARGGTALVPASQRATYCSVNRGAPLRSPTGRPRVALMGEKPAEVAHPKTIARQGFSLSYPANPHQLCQSGSDSATRTV